MEKLAEFLIGLTLFCLALVVLTILALWINSKRIKSNIVRQLSSNDRSGDFVYRLLKTSYPASRILRQAVLPLDDGSRAMADLVLVDNGGVFIIRIKNFPGKIDNSNRATWTVENSKGVGEFPNPFEQNRYALSAVDSILKREKLYNVPKHNVVVFSQKRTVFKIRSEKLVTADNLIETLNDINKNRFLTGKEVNATLTAIKSHSTFK
jgi:hypothetical protein